jgi:hydroxypyruvate isomerase
MEQDQLHHDALQAAQKRLQQYKDGIILNNNDNNDNSDGLQSNSLQSSRKKIQQQQIALAKEYGTKVNCNYLNIKKCSVTLVMIWLMMPCWCSALDDGTTCEQS